MGNEDAAAEYTKAGDARVTAMNELMWRDGMWRDYDMTSGESTAITSAAGLLPIWAGA